MKEQSSNFVPRIINPGAGKLKMVAITILKSEPLFLQMCAIIPYVKIMLGSARKIM